MPGQIASQQIELVAERPGGQRIVCPLEPDASVLVGQSSSCGLRLSGAAVSPLHCLVSFEDGVLWVQDWQSAEGTFVNGQRIDTRTSVAAGEEMQIGEYKLWYAAGAAQAAPSTVSPRPESAPVSSEGPTAEDEAWAAGDDSHAMPATSSANLTERTHELSSDVDSKGGFAEPRYTDPPAGEQKNDFLGDDSTDCDAVQEERGVTSDDGDDPTAIDSLWPSAEEPLRLDPSFFEAETFDAETVALLRAEIEELQAAVAERDARLAELQDASLEAPGQGDGSEDIGDSAALVARLDDLLGEAERSDERVRALEEMLQISEDANRAEQEERRQLEAWLVDIEQRIGQREAEHHAEVESLRRRLEQVGDERDRAERHLQQAIAVGQSPERVEQAVEELRQQIAAQRQQNTDLQQQLDSTRAERNSLAQRLENAESQQDRVLREERAAIAQERAKVSRLRFELSRELAALEEMPKQTNPEDREVAGRLQTLREHLREIHQQEQEAQRQQRESSLTHRVARLWKRVDE